ncbi:MAG TPA: O-antigen ligase family protein [Bryobacteraceae bacterium]|jgi:O-antigen ligase|nr:O-antigen ligase family protein [Bryobacteraceae bacterium]
MQADVWQAVIFGALVLFLVLAFAGTEPWAASILQTGVFALCAFRALRGGWRWHPLALPFAGVIVWGLFQLLAGVTVYRFATERALLEWCGRLALFVLGLQALARSGIRRPFLQAMLYAGFAVALLSTLQDFTSNGAIYWIFPVRAGRPFGPFVNRDHYAAFVELIMPLAIWTVLADRRRAWFHMAIVGVLYGSVIASASRAGVLLVTAELLVLPMIIRPGRAAFGFVAAAAAVGILAAGVVGWDQLGEKLQDTDPFRYRREILSSTVQMIRQRPWTGYGLGTYATVYPEFATFDIGLTVDHAHNDWAEWTAEGGAPLLALMAAAALASLPAAFRAPWALGIHALFLHSLLDFPLQIPALAAVQLTLLAAVCCEDRGYTTKSSNQT